MEYIVAKLQTRLRADMTASIITFRYIALVSLGACSRHVMFLNGMYGVDRSTRTSWLWIMKSVRLSQGIGRTTEAFGSGELMVIIVGFVVLGIGVGRTSFL